MNVLRPLLAKLSIPQAIQASLLAQTARCYQVELVHVVVYLRATLFAAKLNKKGEGHT